MQPAPSSVLVFAVVVTLVDRGSANAKWGYSGPFGPYNWRNVDTSPNVNQCGDKLQSPVDLDDRYAEFDSGLGAISFNGYDQPLYNPYIVNNGHTVQISATEDSNRFIEGARLPGRFQFAQFHLHWGANSSRGSEHTVRGFQYPLEYEDGLAVVAVFFEVGLIGAVNACVRACFPLIVSSSWHPAAVRRLTRLTRPMQSQIS
ncbi:hypothetical protein MRX96_018864 [Rhipicephalus microplus]